MEKKYKVISKDNEDYGKKIKAIQNDEGAYVDIKTGKLYDGAELEEISRKHAAYAGLGIGRFGFFLFVREYIEYKSYQFGCGIDVINYQNMYIDFEVRIACFGIGLRLTKTK